MFVALQLYGQEINSLRSQLKLAEAKQNEILRAEPTSEARAQASNGGKSKYGGPAVFTDDAP
jgi:prefoldin subunit 5